MQNSTTKYGNLYSNIALGFSHKIVNKKDYFFKHPTQAEHFAIYGKHDSIVEIARESGLPTEQEKLDTALKNGWWTEEKEQRYLQLQSLIKNLKKTRANLLLPSQKSQIDQEIQKNKYILTTYQKERYDIIGHTAEIYANDRLYDEMLFVLIYKNKELNERVFTDIEEYYYLPDGDIEKIRREFIADSNMLTYDNIRRVSACTFFQNMLYVTSECDVLSFWGKSASHCTKHQIDLLISGKVFKNYIKNSAEQGNSIDDDILCDPEKLVQSYDSSIENISYASSKTSSSKTSGNAVSSFVGATKDDLKKMGVKVEKIRGKSLLELANESGGVLEKHQYLNARQGV